MEITDRDILRLADFIKSNFGVNLEKKATLIRSRLVNVLEKRNITNFSEYLDFAMREDSGKEMTFLLTRLTTNYTYFMREEQHFKYMKDTLLPNLEKTVRNNDLRIWSAGCSSGEEAYTIAMVIDDYFGLKKSSWDAKVLATDISQKVLAEAKAGIYTDDKLANISDVWKRKYFDAMRDGTFKVKDFIRNEVVYGTFNLMSTTFPFRKKFHVIFCRNVMIYFDKETKLALMKRFCDVLELGGHMIIGVSEPMGQFDRRFTTVMPAVYRKVEN